MTTRHSESWFVFRAHFTVNMAPGPRHSHCKKPKLIIYSHHFVPASRGGIFPYPDRSGRQYWSESWSASLQSLLHKAGARPRAKPALLTKTSTLSQAFGKLAKCMIYLRKIRHIHLQGIKGGNCSTALEGHVNLSVRLADPITRYPSATKRRQILDQNRLPVTKIVSDIIITSMD